MCCASRIMDRTISLRTVIACLCLTAPAFAQQASPSAEGPPPPLATLSDPALRALKERRVVLTVGDQELTGRILGFEAESVTVARDDGTVVTVARTKLTAARLAEPAAPPPATTPPPPSATTVQPPDEEPKREPERPRYFGVHLGMAPGVALDLDYEYFHAFASTSWLFPLVSSGQLFAFTAGMGASIPLTGTTRSSGWRLDFFAHVAPGFEKVSGASTMQAHVGIGAGFGLHYTAPGGWTIGVKLPVIGAATTPYSNSTVGELVGWYYLASAMSLPVFSFGYRF
jgi:hypothetical protein